MYTKSRKRSESCSTNFPEHVPNIHKQTDETKSLPSKRNNSFELKPLPPLIQPQSFEAIREENESAVDAVRSTSTVCGIIDAYIKPTEKFRNPIIRCMHSFKRSRDFDPETGEVNLSHEINGFSVQCIAIGGAIGTGLLIGSGKSLTAGPGPLLLAYLLVSSFIYCMCQSLGELSVAMPINGGFTNYSSKFIDKSWGFAMAWNYCLQWMILLPMELVAASMTFEFWPKVASNFPDWGIISVFFGMIIFMNVLSVKYYGFAEVGFAIIKIAAISLFSVFALLVDIGVFGNHIGFKYWRNPGMISKDGFYGFIMCVITAAFSFAGSELVGVAAAESKNPERMIPKAIKQVFWRIGGFYIVSLFIISLVVPYNHPNLVGSGHPGVNASPFVLALSNIKNSSVFATIMNIVILISILSVGNSSIYASSRTLIALSENKQAPNFINYIDKKKRPIIATLISILVGFLAYISVFWPKGSETVFLWLMSISGISVICSYATICACHIRFRNALKLNDISSEERLSYRSQTGVIGSWYGLILSIVIIVAQVYVAIWPGTTKFSTTDFFQKIMGIVVILTFYMVHKAYSAVKEKKFSFLVDLGEIDIRAECFANDDLRKDYSQRFSLEKEYLDNRPWYKRLYNR